MKLLSEQIEIINDISSNTIILACAGSGKTTVLTHKMYHCCQRLKSYEGIIGLSFTIESSKELNFRFKKINNTKTSNYIATMDSFFINEIIKPFLPHIWQGCKKEFEIINILIGHENLLFSKDYNKHDVKVFLDEISSDQGFKNLYLAEGKILLKSISVLALFVLKNSNACKRYMRTKYKYLFVDEYQDTSVIQHEIFLLLVKEGINLTAVGDINQSIYKWRDAVPKNLTDLASIHCFTQYELNTNHRCHPSINLYANIFLDPFSTTENTPFKSEDQFIFRKHINGDKTTRYAVLDKLISETKELFNFDFSDFLITASTKAPLQYYAKHTMHEYRLDEDDLLKSQNSRTSKLCSALISYAYNDVETIYSIYKEHNFLLKNISLEYLKSNTKNLKEVSSNTTTVYNIIKNVIDNCPTTTTSQNALLATKAILNNDDYLKIYKPRNKKEIQIINIHKAKGLQFKAVIHLGLENFCFPKKTKSSNGKWINFDLKADKNLHYVAITRAEKVCILVSTDYRISYDKKRKLLIEKLENEPSEFLQIQELKDHIKSI